MGTDPPGVTRFQAWPSSPESALDGLTQPVRAWFVHRFGAATLAQRYAWPVINREESLLLCTPTGSGKTLAAVAPILSKLGESGGQCLYIAPLKALAQDVRRTIRSALKELTLLDPRFASIHVGLRTGDTSSQARRRIVQSPPEILITTPESLAVMLSQRSAISVFQQLRWVVIDEVHALAPTKRGADLSLSLERLETLSRPLHRIGLSATCAPLDLAARFLVGSERDCTVAAVSETSNLELVIEPLWDDSASFVDSLPPAFVARLLTRLEPELQRNRTSLIFVSSRSFAERLCWMMTQRFPEWTGKVAVHHSSLAARRRRETEAALKEGKLKAVVATTSLELGIDIGFVDGVILVHPPREVVRLLQRVGRSGLSPRGPRRGLILASHVAELLEATVTANASRAVQIEPLAISNYPLDVLCQQIVGLAMAGTWPKQHALSLIRRAFAFRNLSDEDYGDCLDYLSGLDRDGRAWLPARLRWDEDRFTIVDDATARLLRRNLGTILREDGIPVRQKELGESERCRLIGEVDEVFIDRIQPGDRFVLGGRCWQFERQEPSAVIVQEILGRPVIPRWQSGGLALSPELAERIFSFRLRAAEALRDGTLSAFLQREYDLSPEAAQRLVELFSLQESRSEIPEGGVCLVECVRNDYGVDYYFHTPLNRAGNDAVARVLCHRLFCERSLSCTSVAADLGLQVAVRSLKPISANEWKLLLQAQGFDRDLDQAIDGSPSLRDHFRSAAYTGLMLLRNPEGGRRRVGGHDWAQRRLYDQVQQADPHFPLLRQARVEMLSEVCDAKAARRFIEYLVHMEIRCRRLSSPSPFVEAWTQTSFASVELLEPAAVG